MVRYGLGIAKWDLDPAQGRSTETRERMGAIVDQLPPIGRQNAAATGTDILDYVAEGFGFSAFVQDDGSIYHAYSTTGRGVEFLMGYYAILGRAPEGRYEGDAFQTWIRRHDEY
jgi:predicted dithiol-disulfide oxidoreductase (DUF899 family)